VLKYWWDVFWEGASASIEAVGQPLQVLVYSLLILILGWFLLFRKQGWRAVKQDAATSVGKAILIAIIAWTPFLFYHVCRASYLKWQAADQSAAAHQEETKKCETQLAELNQPLFHTEIADMMYGPFPGSPNTDAILIVTASITNTGAPSIADHMGLTVNVGGVDMNVVPVLPARDKEFINGHGHSVIILSSDFLPRKATDQPIPRGGEVYGYVQGVLKGVSLEKARQPSTVVKLHFFDVNGKRYETQTPLMGKELNFIDSVRPPNRPH
jgi:hypothetical protein